MIQFLWWHLSSLNNKHQYLMSHFVHWINLLSGLFFCFRFSLENTSINALEYLNKINPPTNVCRKKNNWILLRNQKNMKVKSASKKYQNQTHTQTYILDWYMCESLVCYIKKKAGKRKTKNKYKMRWCAEWLFL